MKVEFPKTQLTNEEVLMLIKKDKTSLRVKNKGFKIKEKDIIGVRLNLNLLKSLGVAIQTIHKHKKENYENNKGIFKGEAIDYSEAIFLENAYFNVDQKGREAIASGKENKFPMASIDGNFIAKEIPENYSGISIRFNPKNSHLFIDENNEAIYFAENVVVLGNRAYASGLIIYHNEKTAPEKYGIIPSETIVNKEYKEIIIPKTHLVSNENNKVLSI